MWGPSSIRETWWIKGNMRLKHHKRHHKRHSTRIQKATKGRYGNYTEYSSQSWRICSERRSVPGRSPLWGLPWHGKMKGNGSSCILSHKLVRIHSITVSCMFVAKCVTLIWEIIGFTLICWYGAWSKIDINSGFILLEPASLSCAP
jgi:hypothetical protein